MLFRSVELPALIFSHLTDELYESKIVYRTQLFEDNVRTFCTVSYTHLYLSTLKV